MKTETLLLLLFLSGGNVVLLYAAKYRDVETVVNISGRFFLERGIQARLGKDYFRRIKENGFIDVKNKKGALISSAFWFCDCLEPKKRNLVFGIYRLRDNSWPLFFALQESLNIG